MSINQTGLALSAAVLLTVILTTKLIVVNTAGTGAKTWGVMNISLATVSDVTTSGPNYASEKRQNKMAKKVDRNQAEITRALRSVGATVQPLHTIGQGCVDLLVGFREANYCLEVKDWMQPPSRQRLTPDEKAWHENWRGQKAVVKDVDDALRAIGAIK